MRQLFGPFALSPSKPSPPHPSVPHPSSIPHPVQPPTVIHHYVPIPVPIHHNVPYYGTYIHHPWYHPVVYWPTYSNYSDGNVSVLQTIVMLLLLAAIAVGVWYAVRRIRQ